MVDQYTEPASWARAKLLHDADEIVDAAEMFDNDALDAQIVSPHLLDEFGVVAAFDVDAAGQRDFGGGADRHGARRRASWGLRGLPSRWSENDRLSFDQVSRADREWFPAAAPVLKFHPAVFDPHHGAHITGLGIFDDHAEFDRLLARAGFSMRIVGEDIGAIAISHRVI